MTQLNQILAVEAGCRSKYDNVLTRAHREVQKTPALSGVARTYHPKDDENGDRLPPESTRVQVRAPQIIGEIQDEIVRLLDVTLTKDVGNTEAFADVIIEGQSTPLMSRVPVTYLLWFEKKLNDIHTFVEKLPVLDASEEWSIDLTQGVYATPIRETSRTQKVARVLEKSPATDKHPAQVELVHEDTIVGTWSKREFSGALPVSTVRETLERVEALQRAVRVAREAANSIEIQQQHVGQEIYDYIFTPVIRTFAAGPGPT